MQLQVAGIGRVLPEDLTDDRASSFMFPEIPDRERLPPTIRRRAERLSGLMYVATLRALDDAGLDSLPDDQQVAVVAGTALGEPLAGVEFIRQIHAKRGRGVSPALFQNSVHNAPAGYLSISQRARGPSLTVSQGLLSAEAAVEAAISLSSTGIDLLLIVSGDPYDSGWENALADHGAVDFASALGDKALQEGVVAVLARPILDQSIAQWSARGRIISAGVERAATELRVLERLLDLPGLEGRLPDTIVLRHAADGVRLKQAVDFAASEARQRPRIEFDGPGPGSSLAGPLAQLAQRCETDHPGTMVFLGAEAEDLGWIVWSNGDAGLGST